MPSRVVDEQASLLPDSCVIVDFTAVTLANRNDSDRYRVVLHPIHEPITYRTKFYFVAVLQVSDSRCFVSNSDVCSRQFDFMSTLRAASRHRESSAPRCPGLTSDRAGSVLNDVSLVVLQAGP